MIPELLAIAVYASAGAAALRALGLRGWALAPLGFLAGVSLHIAVTGVLVITFLPTSPVVVLALDVLIAAAALWFARRRGADISVSWVAVAAVGGALAALVAAFRALNLARWHVDSFQYLDAGALLAANHYSDAAGATIVTKRLIGVAAIHSPANLSGDYYLTSVTPLVVFAGLAAMVWFLARGLESRVAAKTVALFATLAVVTLVTTNRFVFHTFYLNGHALAGMLVVAVAGAAWLMISRPGPSVPALVGLAAVASVALVLTRPSGAVLAALALAPLVAHGAAAASSRKVPLAALAVAMLAWQGFTVFVVMRGGGSVPVFALAQAAAAAAVLVAFALPVWGWLGRHSRLIVGGFEIALWAAVVALGARTPSIVTDSITATWANRYVGKWGFTVFMIAALVVGVVLTMRLSGGAPMRLVVTAFIPLVMLLALARGGPYRVGHYDSLNRMWLHILPVAVMFVSAALAGGDGGHG